MVPISEKMAPFAEEGDYSQNGGFYPQMKGTFT